MSEIVPAQNQDWSQLVQPMVDDYALTVEASEADLRAIRKQLRAFIESADAITKGFARVAGPNPAALPAHLRTMMNMGTGYFRHCQHTLDALFKARAARRNHVSKP